MGALNFAIAGQEAAQAVVDKAPDAREKITKFLEWDELQHETFAKYVKLVSATGLGYAFAGALGSLFGGSYAGSSGESPSMATINDNYIGDLPLAGDTEVFLDPFDMQPDPSITEKVAFDPSTATDTDWATWAKNLWSGGGAEVARALIGANRDVDVARAGAKQATGQPPGILANTKTYPSLDSLLAGQYGAAGIAPSSTSSGINLPMIVIGGVIILFLAVFLRR